MKKKALAIAVACLMALTLFAGCKKEEKPVDGPSTSPSTGQQKTLKIWSFTNEVKVFSLAFQEKYPDIKVEYTMIPMTNGEYQTRLRNAITGGDLPDVVVLEASFVREYVESNFLADVSDLLPIANELQTYPFTIDIGSHNGVVKAFSYQATPGAMFYRRSLAKEYFGTDDPDEVQALVSDMDKYEQAAKTIKEKSNGNTYMVASVGDFANLFFANREQPWVVNNKLTIDPQVDKLFDLSKSFRQNGYEAQANQWQEGWFAGMNDSLVDANGQAKQIFSYLLPTWGLPYVLMPNGVPQDSEDSDDEVGKDTTGDWACINGPMPYQWGGTWIAATKNAKNLEEAKEFIKFATLNEETLENWAKGVYSNAYLKNIDSTIGNDLAQGPGDFVSSKKVVDKITASFDNAETSKFLAGQNSYRGFAEAALKLDLKLLQATDDAIQRALNDPLANYASGSLTKDEAIAEFKEAVKTAVIDIDVD
jgi:multiple sugar transport system substrate-binding protein